MILNCDYFKVNCYVARITKSCRFKYTNYYDFPENTKYKQQVQDIVFLIFRSQVKS